MGIFLVNLFLYDNNFANISSNLLFLIIKSNNGFIKQVIIIFKKLSVKKTIFLKKKCQFLRFWHRLFFQLRLVIRVLIEKRSKRSFIVTLCV